jgi:hypothetical protein
MVSVNPERSYGRPSRDAGPVHRAGFRSYWRWQSRSRGGRPQIETDLRALIRRMSIENPLWGAPRIHGELLKLGFEVAQSSVAKYMVKRRGPPSQGWRTFLRNHGQEVARFSGSGPSHHTRSLAGFIIITFGLGFRYTQPPFAQSVDCA